MAEWLVEQGIGETRAALVKDGCIIEARIEVEGTIPAGSVVRAKLTSIGSGGRNGTARDESGTDYLLPTVSRGITEGSPIQIEITRPALPGLEPWKLPLAKITPDEPREVVPLVERLRAIGTSRRLVFPAAKDELAEAGWNDLIEEARSGRVDFAGGTLGLFHTPAMTLIDVDGVLPASELMIRGAQAAAGAIRRLDIGGSVGIDFPTVGGKDGRKAAAEMIDLILPQPFERTAINGFGFLQIVRSRSRPSLLEAWSSVASAEARALLRRLVFECSGTTRLVAHPAIIAVLESHTHWLDVFARQIGGAVSLRSNPKLPIHGGYAENL